MASFQKFFQTVQDIGRGVYNLNADTFKTLLTNTAPTTGNAVLADITDLSTGSGYTAGGTASGSNSYSQSGGVGKFLCADVVFTSSGTIGPFRYPVLYDTTPTSPLKPLTGYFDYGSSISLLNGETFTVDYDGTNGTFTIT